MMILYCTMLFSFMRKFSLSESHYAGINDKVEGQIAFDIKFYSLSASSYVLASNCAFTLYASGLEGDIRRALFASATGSSCA